MVRLKARENTTMPLLVLSFDPHPEAYFSPHTAPARLSSLGERVLMLRKTGVDIACIVPFDRHLAVIEHLVFDSFIALVIRT